MISNAHLPLEAADGGWNLSGRILSAISEVETLTVSEDGLLAIWAGGCGLDSRSLTKTLTTKTTDARRPPNGGWGHLTTIMDEPTAVEPHI